MKVTYIPSDTLIIVDGVEKTIPSATSLSIHNGLHALQWQDMSGHLEWKDTSKPNTDLLAEDFDTHVQPYVAQYEAYVAEEAKRKAEEEAARQAEHNSEESCFKRLRCMRDRKITDTDYLMTIDYPITEECRESLKTYRQALRDITSLEGAPWDGGDDGTTVPWPVEPEIVKTTTQKE